MAKKSKFKKLMKSLFGNEFNMWDVLIVGIIGLYGYRKWLDGGVWGLFDTVAGVIFFAYVVAIIVKFLRRKSTGK